MKTVEVQGAILTERADGVRVLAISSKTGQWDLEFSPETWEQLADTARWFHERTNGVNNDVQV